MLSLKASNTKDLIKLSYNNVETNIKTTINEFNKKGNDKELKERFSKLVNKNKETIDNLITNVNNIKSEYDKYLIEKNTEIINKLDLQELQKEKDEFKNNMSKFESANVSNISCDVNQYNREGEKPFFFFWKSKYYDINETINKYDESITNFFKSKEGILEVIDKNKDKVIKDIEGIFEKFNQKMDGFFNNYKEFEKIIKELDIFIYKAFGIRD